jgi:DNA-binding GntR family transcriptional regulator
MITARKHRPNLSEIAYDEIKEMILSGDLAQGERIVLERMSERLNLSITPIREALNKLAQDDLIKVTPLASRIQRVESLLHQARHEK